MGRLPAHKPEERAAVASLRHVVACLAPHLGRALSEDGVPLSVSSAPADLASSETGAEHPAGPAWVNEVLPRQ